MADVAGEKTFTIYIITSMLLCTIFSICFDPIIFRDSIEYINIAKDFLGQSECDKGNRSPLYIFLLAGLMKLFGEENYLTVTFFIQYAMIFVVSILVYKIFEKLTSNARLSFLTGILFLLNLSTNMYGYLILTETLTMLLFILLSYMIICLPSMESKNYYCVILGSITALLILARYNIFFIPFWVIVSIFFCQYFVVKNKSMRHFLTRTILFSVPLLVILNLWCFRNYDKFDFYFLFPTSGNAASRNAQLAVLNEESPVSERFVEVKRILLNSKKRVLSRKRETKKGSLFQYVDADFFYRIHSGYKIYINAEKDLFAYYHLNDQKKGARFWLAHELGPFYKELAQHNKLSLIPLRISSLLFSFKASTCSLGSEVDSNSNRFPSCVFLLYRLAFIVAMGIFLLLSCVYLIKIIKNKTISKNYVYLTLLWLIFYFPFINTFFITLMDAPRFKYPAEPLIIGLLVFYVAKLIRWGNFRGKYLA